MSALNAFQCQRPPVCQRLSRRAIWVVAGVGAGCPRIQVSGCAGSRSAALQRLAPPRSPPRPRGRRLVVRATAMVNVDFASPSLLLGAGLIGCGVLLLNLRNFQNKVSRDADIVVAAMVSIVGSTLIFQGWRLDPLLLLCQALTTSVAFWYGLETFRLRAKEADMAPPPQLPPPMGEMPYDPAMQQPYQQQGGLYPPPGAPFLPPPTEGFYPWGAAQGQQQPYSAAANPYAETIQYDYYGNPILPQEQQYEGNAAAAGPATVAYGEPAPYGGVQTANGGWPAGASGRSDAGMPYGSVGAPYAGQAGAGPGPGSGPGFATGGFGVPYGGMAAGLEPQQPQSGGSDGSGQLSLPPAVGSGSPYGPGLAVSAAQGDTAPGYGASYGSPVGQSGGYPSVGGAGPSAAGWEGRRGAAAPGAGAGGGRGRLELHEQVDDWE